MGFLANVLLEGSRFVARPVRGVRVRAGLRDGARPDRDERSCCNGYKDREGSHVVCLTP